MLERNWKNFTVIAFSLLTIFFYYFQFPHGESKNGLGVYLLIMIFLYLCYKAYYIFLEYEHIHFGVGKILSFSLLHFFILSSFLFMSSGLSLSYAFVFLFRILFFLFCIFGIFTILYLFGKSILGYFLKEYDDTSISQKSWHKFLFYISGKTLLTKQEETLLSFALGIISFFFFLSLLAFFSLYSAANILILFTLLFLFSLREIPGAWKDFSSLGWDFENHSFDSSDSETLYRPYLLSTEFLFIVVTGIISVNFISVFRPFPIGWDDLGVYMNYPKLLSGVGGNMPLGSMYPWQLFTGIGYLFHSQTFAFLLNSFASFMSLIVISLGFSSLFGKEKKTFFNIPLLSATIFLGLPMVVFQTAKDMKLDIGLFSISFLALILLYTLYSHISRFNKRHIVLFLFTIGALAGLAFTIKVTSLLLISGILGVIFYIFSGYLGFLGYVFLYMSLFTLFKLWGIMNITLPSSDMFIVSTSSILFIVSTFCFYLSFLKKTINVKSLLTHISIFILGVIVSFIPWGLKNISELSHISELSVYRLIGGKAVYFAPNYLEIYSADEYAQKKKNLENQKLDENGNTSNEDMGRYFGYETGVNNYLKLPWNLTMQVNQKGEFTDIGFLFFALLPSIFLFLPSKNKYFSLTIAATLIFSLLYFIPSPLGIFLGNIFSFFTLPLGYAIIFMIYFGFFSFLFFSLERKQKEMDLFIMNLIFSTFFIFLWAVSAFGVVWYGITMYGCFLLMIAIAFFSLSSYDEHHTSLQKNNRFSQSSLIFGIFIVYIFISIIPRYVSNLHAASFVEYKMGKYSENRSVYASHPEYLSTLFALNIDDTKKEKFVVDYKNSFFQILSKYQMNQEVFEYLTSVTDIQSLESFALQISTINDPSLSLMQKEFEEVLESLYNDITYPNNSIASQQKIFKIGTFMKYFIYKNNERIHDDGLLTDFDAYIYDTDSQISVERLKKLGISYFLIDLNAATIDNDPRRNLTTRYENLLSLFPESSFQLVDTDSICLKVALEDYAIDKNKEKYMLTAGVNYESYMSDGSVTPRGNKLQDCHTRIIEILRNPRIDITKQYTYLVQIVNYLAQNGKNLDDEGVIRDILMKFGVGYKALFKIQ